MNDHLQRNTDEGRNLGELLSEARTEGGAALNDLFQRLYRELRVMAHRQLQSRGRPDNLNTTALVHEAFLRFSTAGELSAQDQRHFLAYASTAMRSVVIDVLRAQASQKRGGGAPLVTLNTDIADDRAASVQQALRIHEALLVLGKIDAQLVQIVEMRFFAGLSEEQIAESLDLSPRTVHRHWQKARLFLYAQLNPQAGED